MIASVVLALALAAQPEEAASPPPPGEPIPAVTASPPPVPPAAPPPPPAAPVAAGCTMAVLDLEAGDGVRRERAQAFTDVVTGEVGNLSPCSVLSRSDVRGVLSFEAEKQLLGCNQESCLAELAGALGADLLVTGSLSKIDEATLLSLRVTDLKSLKVTRRATDSYSGADEDAIAFVAWLTRKLMTDDVTKIGDKPKATARKNVLVERKQTIWRTLAWTGVVGTTLSGLTAAGFGVGTVVMSESTKSAREQNAAGTSNETDRIRQLTETGPVVASVANVAIYVTAGLLVGTVPLFFLPGEEIVEVQIGATP